MDDYVARQNIERYRRQLDQTHDGAERRTLLELLMREETRLARILARKEEH